MQEKNNEQLPGPGIEVWASAEVYERYVGRWSRLVARQFISWLDIPPGSLWLDVGCGAGAWTEAILDTAQPGRITGIDSSAKYIAYLSNKVGSRGASIEQGDARSLPVASGAYNAVVSGLALNFIPEPERVVAEMRRAAVPGGVVAAYVWDYAGKMQMMRHFWNAAVALAPEIAGLDQGRRFPVCNPGPLAELFHQAGLAAVEVRPVDIWTEFKDFDDYWLPFLGGQGSAPGYVGSLSEEGRAELRERIRSGLPFALDGSIPLMARAWAVRGVR